MSLALRAVTDSKPGAFVTVTEGDLTIGEANTPAAAVASADAPAPTVATPAPLAHVRHQPTRKSKSLVRIIRGLHETEYDVKPERPGDAPVITTPPVTTQYAKDRIVFDRPIGQNQSIQHPLAHCWMELEAAWLMTMRAASLYDAGQPCGVEANAAKYLAGEAGFEACTQAVMTHGGMGYAKEFHVERLLREVLITRLAPVSPQLILCHIAEKALGLPKSY